MIAMSKNLAVGVSFPLRDVTWLADFLDVRLLWCKEPKLSLLTQVPECGAGLKALGKFLFIGRQAGANRTSVGEGSKPGSNRLLRSVRCSLFDQSCNLLRPGDVDRGAGARDFDLVAVGSCGIPAFEVRVNGSVFCRYQHPAWFASPRSRGDYFSEVVSKVEYLRARHESGLLGRQVGCEVLMKLCGVEVSETVCRLLYRTRLAEV